jgi:hypothetical protein
MRDAIVIDLFRPRAAVEAEILVLRQQIGTIASHTILGGLHHKCVRI